MYNIKLLILTIVFIILVCAGVAQTAPIYIEADRMESVEKSNAVLFAGDVDAKKDDLRIRSDEMTVFYADSAQSAAESTTQQVEKIICVGNVEITRENWVGTADKMVYLQDEQQVVLTGGAKAWQDQNMVGGEKIIYYIAEGRSEVVGGDRVQGTVGDTKEKKKSRVKMTIIQK